MVWLLGRSAESDNQDDKFRHRFLPVPISTDWKIMAVDRYAVNDALTALAENFGITLDDDTLNELTHHVSDVLDAIP